MYMCIRVYVYMCICGFDEIAVCHVNALWAKLRQKYSEPNIFIIQIISKLLLNAVVTHKHTLTFDAFVWISAEVFFWLD